MDKIGERVKSRREHQVMQLSELAQKVGVTKSCLSQIENGKAFPSIVTLKKIADNLHSTIGELVGDKERLEFNPLIKLGERNFVKKNKSGASLYLLSHHDLNKQLETYFVEFDIGSDATDIIETHPGQSFCYIVNGKIEITLKEKIHILTEGDSFYFNSFESHLFRNLHTSLSKMIWVVATSNL